MRLRRAWSLVAIVVLTLATAIEAADPPPLDAYFRAEVERIERRPLAGIDSAAAWKAARPELQAKLRAMLGLDPWPERTPLQSQVTGTIERPDFVVETILFQSRPGLYVTANLYRPKTVATPLPAILYVCGHSKIEQDGVILGAKVHYQHHAAWYASNGYVCLVLDTLQLGELPGLHHGTSKFGLWWWPARGYTPAGVEAWNAVRAIDYLESRPEVAKSRIGMTGRSGGGATTWWTAAIDDRVAVAVPVAGITDLRNHVIDGTVEGHCDCMYQVNTERWDFDVIAALVAPRPMLVENTDKDPIFPEDGVRRIYRRVETVYGWYGASDKLGLVIGKGGHIDSEEVRHPSFAFMDRWLKGIERPIIEPDRRVPGDRLTVIAGNKPPADNGNPTIHERFRPPARPVPPPGSSAEWKSRSDALRTVLAAKVFAGWPSVEAAGPLDVTPASDRSQDAVRIRSFDYTTQPGIRLRYWTIERAGSATPPGARRVIVLDEADWRSGWASILAPSGAQRPISTGDGFPAWIEVRDRVLRGEGVVLLAPRGVGPSAWPIEKDKQIRRRFMLLGQTLDGMRVWDVRRGIEAWADSGRSGASASPTTFAAAGSAATWLLWALVTSPAIAGAVELTDLPASVHAGPAYLNLETVLDMPEAVSLLHPRPLRLIGGPRAAWDWSTRLGTVLGTPGWPRVE